MSNLRRLSAFFVAVSPALFASGCEPEGCLGGEEGCRVPAPCQNVEVPVCEDTSLTLKVIEPGDPIRLLGSSGEHDHRHVTHLSDPPQDVEPVDTRQHHVEHHEIGRLGFE